MHRYGIMLSCGWLPPVDWMAPAFIGPLIELGSMNWAKSVLPAQNVLEGLVPLPDVLAKAGWLWLGIWFTVNVTDSSPAIWAWVKPFPI